MSEAVEQIRQAQAYKEEGNALYGDGNYKKALGSYHKVFCFLNGLHAPPETRSVGEPSGGDSTLGSRANQIPKDSVEDVKRLKQTTRLNMAACYLKVGEPQKCIDACSKALEFGENAKAHFRRAQAYADLRNFSGAQNDLERARELNPDDPAVVAELRKLKAAFAQGDASERKKCARMLSGATDPRTQQGETQQEEAQLGVAIPDDEVAVTSVSTGGPGNSVSSSAPILASPPVDDEACNLDMSPTPDAAPADTSAATNGPGGRVSSAAAIVAPTRASDEARRLDVAVRSLTYSWQQTDDHVKVYVAFDQSEELSGGVDKSRVQIEYGEWSILLLIQSTVEGRVPLGLRLGDFHRRVDPEKCRCTVRSSRITLELVKQVKEHWWNLLQSVPLHSS